MTEEFKDISDKFSPEDIQNILSYFESSPEEAKKMFRGALVSKFSVTCGDKEITIDIGEG